MAGPVRLDGGHGGGQVLRTALALSVLTERPFAMERIRGARRQPGLRPQHLAAVHLAARIAGAETEGAEAGSTSLVFRPGRPGPGDHEADIGTAGSVTLVLQAVVPVLLTVPGESRVWLGGGTDVPHAPPWDWFSEVFLPRVALVADQLRWSLVRRGFHPRGGGRVRLDVRNAEGPWSAGEARRRVAARLAEAPPAKWPAEARIRSVASEGLAGRRVAHRQAEAARIRLEEAGVAARAEVLHEPADSPGSVCTVWFEHLGWRIGGNALGGPGRRAEDVGRAAADEALADREATVDRHLADQMVPFVGLGACRERCPRPTEHLERNLETVRAFLGPNAVGLDGAVLRGVRAWP